MKYILNLSYGKDSIACIEAIKQLDLPLDHIIHAEIWATDTISADLPPMVEFKKQADEIIKKRYGIEVEHISAMKNSEKLTYEKLFYTINNKKKQIYGFPISITRGNWCTMLKIKAINPTKGKNIQYLGIAADESERIKRHTRDNVILPLVKIGWTEADCLKWCKENDLLSPIYENTTRGGCWFCHNQNVDSLRILRKNYPDLWKIFMKWDTDSPTTFKPDGHTIHDYDKRFEMEKESLIPTGTKFKWDMIHDPNILYQMTIEEFSNNALCLKTF